ncbi:MAG: S-adenosyl-l-methionine hydroxide adenosyltransferase family protein [Planctomycetota bacterium]
MPLLRPRVVTLTTDFGAGSIYVAEVKGRLLSAAVPVTLVDITHTLPPHDVSAGAWMVARGCFAFPDDSLHVVVVDPGVGTGRRLVWARIGRQQFLAPDNGVLSLAIARHGLVGCHRLAVPAEASSTFHGRDVLAPAAVRLLEGTDPAALGAAVADLVTLPLPRPFQRDKAWHGVVVDVDAFGNLVTNLPADLWPAVVAAGAIDLGPHHVRSLVRTYGDANPGTAVTLVGSQDVIEVAVVQGSAASRFGAGVGSAVTIPAPPQA